MAVSHAFSNAMGDWTGTVTAFNSTGGTTTVAATNLVRPVDWNSAHNQFYTLSGNTNNASTVSGSNIVLQGAGGVTLTGSNQTILFNAPAATTLRNFAPFDEAVGVAGGGTNLGNGSLHVYPFIAPNVQHDRIVFRIIYSNTTGSSGSVTLSQRCGIYTRNASTLSLLSSTSSSWAVTNSGTQGVYASVGGQRLLTIPWTNTLSQGEYWMGIVSQTATGGTDCSISQIVASQLNSNLSGVFSAANNATNQRRLGFGFYTATTAAMPAAIAFSEINGSASSAHRPPMWFMVSQTA